MGNRRNGGHVLLAVGGVAGLAAALALLIPRRASASVEVIDKGPLPTPPELLERTPSPRAATPRSTATSTGAQVPAVASFDSRDLEAGARMIASENPRGSDLLKIEQLWTEIRSANKRSMWTRITGGEGWGPQGGKRPVATVEPATKKDRDLTEAVYQGLYPSTIPGAKKFFDAVQQDKAFRIAEQGREKAKRGEELTPQEKRLAKYHHDAAGIRQKWTSEGARYLDTIDGVEFYT